MDTLKEDLQHLELGNKRTGFARNWEYLFKKNKFKIICEIGVDRGKNLREMMKSYPSEMVAIDPWKYDSNDFSYGSQIELDKHYEDVKKEYENNPFIKIIRDYSFNVVNTYPNEYFDVVYIDGNHTYNACLKDIRDWYPKVAKGGILCGDDYRYGIFRDTTFGVIQATETFRKEKGLEVIPFPRFAWAIIK